MTWVRWVWRVSQLPTSPAGAPGVRLYKKTDMQKYMAPSQANVHQKGCATCSAPIVAPADLNLGHNYTATPRPQRHRYTSPDLVAASSCCTPSLLGACSSPLLPTLTNSNTTARPTTAPKTKFSHGHESDAA